MSASLVGSEMCIRDRLICLSAYPLIRASAYPLIRLSAHLLIRLSAHFQICLLYTSDAADDM
eukprot:11688091-Alexandrium_andersonii.AAC.1